MQESRAAASMRLYGSSLSPFVRKVLMALAHKQMRFELVPIVPFAVPEWFASKNPLRRIPVLEDGQTTLADSSVICAYLEQVQPHAALYPEDAVQRARALWLEELADTRLQELLGVGIFFERLLKPALLGVSCSDFRVQRSIEALPPLLTYLEEQLDPSRPYSCGETLCVADLILPGVFLNASYAGYEVSPSAWPTLAGYLSRMLRHPLYAARILDEESLLAGLRERVDVRKRAVSGS